MANTPSLILYDISSPKQPRSFAPNPSKSRFALSFKGLEFETRWIDLLDLENVRKGLNCPATRKFDDGSDYYTLPMLHIPSTNTTLGDSFDIATFLDENFPESGAGRLFPPSSHGKWQHYKSPAPDVSFAPITTNAGAAAKYAAYAKFNLHVDATFSTVIVGYGQYLPFNPETADAAKAQMCKRAHLKSWDDLVIVGEARKALREPFQQNLRGLAECFEGGGVYLEGATACYADLIVGGWLNMMSVLMPQDEWEDFRTWYGGVFAKLHDELQTKYFVCN